jgi:hypothetical protein
VGEKRIEYRVLVGKLEEKDNIWRHRCRWKNNIKRDITETVRENVECLFLAWNRDYFRTVVNMVMGLGVPYSAGELV